MLVFPDRRLSFGAVAERSREIAKGLMASGIAPGDHVGIYSQNLPDVVEHLFGISLCGGVAVMINARYRVEELRFVAANARLRLLFTTTRSEGGADFPARLESALPDLERSADPGQLLLADAPALRSIVCWDDNCPTGFVPHSRFLAGADSIDDRYLESTRQAIAVRDPVIMMYTSGTTANPKGCLLSHEAVVRSAAGMAQRLDIRAEDRLWDPLPMFHMAAILPLLAMVERGGCYLSDTHFEAGAALQQITHERASILYPAFPAIMSDLVEHPAFNAEALGSVRLVNNVAPAEQLRRNMRLLPKAVHISAYGLTEAGGISCHGDPSESDEVRATTCGRPYPGVQMQVVDTGTGQVLPPGKRGEMRIRGFSLFSGYFNAGDATREAFDREGWFRTGDICSLTEAGQVVYHGRLKDLLKIGGENVSPLELESYLGGLDGVALAQVVGVPDPRLQEVAAAFIQLRPGAALSEQEVLEACRGRIASFKVPRYVCFVDEWPMSATKIQKHVLRGNLLKELKIDDR